MGIPGIYREIGKGERIALSKLATETLEQKSRPLRLAIDISIWLFQIQSSRGGTNPALRTFYYRLLRLIQLSIQPLFVFDGPNKPPFKRNKRTGPNVASVPEFLAKQLLKQFGLTFHIAPGEAEAECALLQKEGIVDAVLSEDVDTLMFGSRLTLRSWSAEPGTGTKQNTHVNLYDAEKTRIGPSGLDSDGMILVAMMSGGDYTPEGIPGCGTKIACEAARAGFGTDLCRMSRRNKMQRKLWRDRLQEELRDNKSGFFRQRHKKLDIPDSFPREDILFYYTNPVVSGPEQIQKLRETLQFDQPIDFKALREFCGEAFAWTCISGAKKFVRNLAPALLVRELRLRGPTAATSDSTPEDSLEAEKKYILAIHSRRNHKSTDDSTELRVTYAPMNLVNIDLDAEDPDPEVPTPFDDSDDDETNDAVARAEDPEEPVSPSKRVRGPYLYDPTKHEKIWLMETIVKMGAPVTAEDWEASDRQKHTQKAAKEATRLANATARANKKKTNGTSMPRGALDRFTRVVKANTAQDKELEADPFISTPSLEVEPPVSTEPPAPMPPSEPVKVSAQESAEPPKSTAGGRLAAAFRLPPSFAFPSPPTASTSRVPVRSVAVDLLSSPPQRARQEAFEFQCEIPDLALSSSPRMASLLEVPAQDDMAVPSPGVTVRRKRSPLRRAKTVGEAEEVDPAGLPSRRSPARMIQQAIAFQRLPKETGLRDLGQHRANRTKTPGTPPRQGSKSREAASDSMVISLLSSSPETPRAARQKSITDWATPSRRDDFQRHREEPHEKLAVLEEEPRQVKKAPGLRLPPAFGQPATEAETTASVSTLQVAPRQLTGTKPQPKQKRTLRIRKSLEDKSMLGPDTPQKPDVKRSRIFRLSQAELIDLTADDPA